MIRIGNRKQVSRKVLARERGQARERGRGQRRGRARSLSLSLFLVLCRKRTGKREKEGGETRTVEAQEREIARGKGRERERERVQASERVCERERAHENECRHERERGRTDVDGGGPRGHSGQVKNTTVLPLYCTGVVYKRPLLKALVPLLKRQHCPGPGQEQRFPLRLGLEARGLGFGVWGEQALR